MATSILGIETSCDDTAAAIFRDGQLLSNIVSTQMIHKRWGGVVPEAASRAHIEKIVPVVEAALGDARVQKGDISAIACTQGPGLLGSLLVGFSFAKSMSSSLGIPFIPVNHLQAHVLSHFIEPPFPDFPFLCLTVSGGHTQLVIVQDHLEMEILGQTLDDAAGEAFDKTGKLLGLEYPAGPEIDKLARQGKPTFTFPEPEVDHFDFSFSGLKTSIKYFLRDETKKDPDFIGKNLADICASVQSSIVHILLNKLKAASEFKEVRTIGVAGGVSANSELRRELKSTGDALGWEVFIPRLEYCTDNAAMIACAGYYKFLRSEFGTADVAPAARLPL
jgi:N6-L-threonylcarbamoyladenine synthase